MQKIMMRPHLLCAALALLLTALTATAAEPQHFDLVLRGGRIVDGTGNPWFRGDVAVRGDRIAYVGVLRDGAFSAEREIDAGELVIAPGFIDVHTHADAALHRLPRAENFVRNGVTTIVTGNCGASVGDIGQYFRRLSEEGVAINVATLVGHNTVLRTLKGNVARDLTPEELDRARQIVDQAMRDGAVGLSTGLIYTPGRWSETEEIIELQKVAAAHGGIYATHMRSEGKHILAAIDEALRIGRESGSRVQISHFKLLSDFRDRVGGSDATLQKVMEARAAGQEVWLDQYPYGASSTSINTLLPSWVLEDGPDEAKRKVADPEQLSRLLANMRQTFEVERGRASMEYVVIASCRAHPEYNGRNLKEVAQLMKLHELAVDMGGEVPADRPLPDVSMEDQYRAVVAIMASGGASCVFHSMAEEDVVNILRHPLVAIASDSGVREMGVGVPHPRGYGTNARVLGHYSRDLGVIPLEEAVRKMTSLPALAFRFDDRGLVREGYVADLVVFDAAAVRDPATFEDPHHYAEGMRHVIVNGTLLVEDGKMGDVLPGRPVYGPGARRE